jgi:hypothetical protein
VTGVAPRPKLGAAIGKLQGSLTALADAYRMLGERHIADADVHHLALALAKQCEGQAEVLAPHRDRHGRKLDESVGETPRESLFEPPQRKASRLPAGRSSAGALLLHDLRGLHLAIEEAAMLWLIVGQAAQATRDRELLVLVERSRKEITHQLMWVTGRIKETSPQVLIA